VTLPFGFTSPAQASIGSVNLDVLIAAVVRGDELALAAIRTEYAGDTDALDRFIVGLRGLVAGDFAQASRDFAQITSEHWYMPAVALCVIATAAGGDCRRAIEIANRMSDVILERLTANEVLPTYARDAALRREVVRCIKLAEAAYPGESGPVQIETPLRYIVGYPRSGNTLLAQFLSFAFAAPRYTVYPAVGRYFSQRFHERAPGHPVFVSDHVLRAQYTEEEILSPIRDGRDATVSLARFLHAESGTPFIQHGELADFISYVSARMPYGFWGRHTRALLEAGDRGVKIRLVRYEEIVGNSERLFALARDLAGGGPIPCADQAAFLAFVAREQRRLAVRPEWSEGLPLPDDSFIPRNWSIGGGTIDWRQAFDKPARRRFHDLGGTEMLVRLGYEADEGWWRRG
jgi:hypothetical protein